MNQSFEPFQTLSWKSNSQSETTSFQAVPENANGQPAPQFDGSLISLIETIRGRSERACRIIHETSDPDIIESEMRFLRPYRSYIRATHDLQKWHHWSRELTGELSTDLLRITPLVWLPKRDVFCELVEKNQGSIDETVCRMMRSLDDVLFNFFILMARCRSILGIEDSERFQLITKRHDMKEGYTLALHAQGVHNQQRQRYLITVNYTLHDGETVRIKKDYTHDLANPSVVIRLTTSPRTRKLLGSSLEYRGQQSDLDTCHGSLRILK
ncbi:MAG: hypothetical protein HUJ26_15430 [Planctomycetaceae bacterium]|nr:hypothetical protein [Planctomycetaceae bacterium]